MFYTTLPGRGAELFYIHLKSIFFWLLVPLVSLYLFPKAFEWLWESWYQQELPSFYANLLYGAYLGSILGFFIALEKEFAKEAKTFKSSHHPRFREIAKMMQNLCDVAGLNTPYPRLIIRSEKNDTGFATRSLLHGRFIGLAPAIFKLPNEVIEAILAHEIAHLKHRDVFMSFISHAFQNGLNIFKHLLLMGGTMIVMFWMTILSSWLEIHDFIFWLMLIAATSSFLLICELLFNAYSRQREYLADLGAVVIMGTDPGDEQQMADCLVHIVDMLNVYNKAVDEKLTLNSHPTLRDRVAMLHAKLKTPQELKREYREKTIAAVRKSTRWVTKLRLAIAERR